MSADECPVIRIDQADSVELIELLEFVESWLAQAAPAVEADFRAFMADGPYPMTELRTDLITWAIRLAFAPGERP